MPALRLGGVPEHFNLPWHEAIARGDFARAGVTVRWTDYPEGTGRMMEALVRDEADAVVALTEGIVRAAAQGQPVRLVQWYVTSPLRWGLHVGAQSPFRQIADLAAPRGAALRGAAPRYAISRFGSGSHLMSYVDAHQRGWPLTDDQMVVVNDLAGAQRALTDGAADVFLWERFTTQPLVDAGVFRRLGECPTPWPCFAVAVHAERWPAQRAALGAVLDVVRRTTAAFMADADASARVAARYGLRPDEAAAWYAQTRWATAPDVGPDEVQPVADALARLQLIPADWPAVAVLG